MNKTLLLLSFLLPSLLSLGAKPGDFRYFQNLTPPENIDRDRLNSVELPPEALSELECFDDLRLFAADGRELPFLLRKRHFQKPDFRSIPVPGRIKSFERNANQAVLIVEAGLPEDNQGETVHRLTIETADRNFEKKVTVYGRADRKDEWRQLSEPQLFFNHYPNVPLANRNFDLPGERCRELKIVIDNYVESRLSPLRKVVTDETAAARQQELEIYSHELKIDGVRLERLEENLLASHVRQREYPLRNLQIETDPGRKATVISFDAARLPLHALEIVTTGNNFSREVRLETPEREHLAAGWIHRFDLLGLSRRDTWLPLGGERRLEKAEIIIFNQDNPPLRDLDLRAHGPIYHLITLPDDVPFRLAFRSDDQPAGRYELERVLSGANPEVGPFNEYRTGPTQTNPDYRPAQKSIKFNGKPFFLAAAIIMAAGLLFFIVRNFRKLNQELPPE